jgi:hypothetical protein
MVKRRDADTVLPAREERKVPWSLGKKKRTSKTRLIRKKSLYRELLAEDLVAARLTRLVCEPFWTCPQRFWGG